MLVMEDVDLGATEVLSKPEKYQQDTANLQESFVRGRDQSLKKEEQSANFDKGP